MTPRIPVIDDDDSNDPDDDDDDDDDDAEEDDPDEEDDDVPDDSHESGSDFHRSIKAVSSLESLNGLRELGREALCWQLSSAKPGNGVEQIRDHSLESYWQSDGHAQPHWIQIHFGRRVAISHVCLYLDFALDESYTPRRLLVQIGMTQQDLVPAGSPVEVIDPTGWCIIPLQAPPDPLDDPVAAAGALNTDSSDSAVVKTHLVRISVLSMHQNGRDTHVRNVQLFGPRQDTGLANATAMMAPPVSSRRTEGGDNNDDNEDDDDDDDDMLFLMRQSAATGRSQQSQFPLLTCIR
jgi:anaphase-promoting complex subunit 10